MSTIPEGLKLAIQHHQAGNLQQAEHIFRQILQVDPQQVDALYRLGLIAGQVGRYDLAIEYISRTLCLQPDFAEAHANLGVALAKSGKLDDAVASYRQALRLQPDFAEAHGSLASALVDQGSLEEAIISCRQALRLKPDYVEAHFNLGVGLAEQGKLEEAAVSYREALRLRPDYAEAHNNLGNALMASGKLTEAVASYQQALRLKPDYVEACNNLAAALLTEGRTQEAVATCRQALLLKPDYAEAHVNLGVGLAEQGKLEEAAVSYRQALRLRPDHAVAHRNLAILWLLQGNFEQGWPEYEWRLQCKGFAVPMFAQPRWDGSHLAGKAILLRREQGLGDTLQFVRYTALVKERGGRVIVQCHLPLLRLLTSCRGIDELVPDDSPLPPFDVWAPLLSLPGLFKTSERTIPAPVPYLSPNAELVAFWQHELRALDGFKIGIAWRGNPRHREDRKRSIPLAEFLPLAAIPGVRLVSLQKGAGTEQIAELGGRFLVEDLGSRLDEHAGAFMDTAAVMRHLDLVITCDTAIGHLAGALGVPVWLALCLVPDWRWQLDRQDSPWYPTMRLFRQTEAGNWQGVFARMAEELRSLCRQRVSSTTERQPGEEERNVHDS